MIKGINGTEDLSEHPNQRQSWHSEIESQTLKDSKRKKSIFSSFKGFNFNLLF